MDHCGVSNLFLFSLGDLKYLFAYRYGDIVPERNASRKFTIVYLCLSVLLVGAVMAISREYMSVARRKSEWDSSRELADRMRAINLEEDTSSNSDATDTGGEDVPPAPGVKQTRRKTARYWYSESIMDVFINLCLLWYCD